MNTHDTKTQENKSRAMANAVTQGLHSNAPAFRFIDNRPKAIAQRSTQEFANNRSKVRRLSAIQEMADNSPRAKKAAQLQAMADKHSSQPQAIRSSSDGVIQRKIGFEMELLALVDVNGRPPHEKSYLGRFGAENLELQVDHNGTVEGTTPVTARDANFKISRKNPVPPAMPAAGDFMQFGAYDLRAGEQSRVSQDPAMALAPDPRPVGGNAALLTPQGWAAETANLRYVRPPNDNNTGLDNAELVNLDGLIPNYFQEAKNWEADRAYAHAIQIKIRAQTWLSVNNTPPDDVTFNFVQKRRRNRYLEARAKLKRVSDEAEIHARFWMDPANANIPAHMTRLFRRAPTENDPNPDFEPLHPRAGGGNDRYASILEIVTQAYEPETAPGRAGLVAAMTEARTLADAINANTMNFANRIQMNTIPNVTVFDPQTFVGNNNPTRNPQSTDASIQSTFALDLTQIASFVKSTVGLAPQTRFKTKHQGDNPGNDAYGYGEINRSDRELSMAMVNATAITNELKAHIGGAAPNFVNLRGLLILVCQYLRMGKYWQNALDKNIANLLSRTDLSQQFKRLVPQAERDVLNNNDILNYLYLRILHHTGRKPTSTLFTNEDETLPGPSHIPISCQTFIRNVFTKSADGVTKHFGGFKKLNPESVDPAGARAGDTRDHTAAQREGAVFELRNMIPKLNNRERFPVTEWVGLAEYMASMFEILNARQEATATSDVVVQDINRAVPNALPNVNINRTDPAW